MRNAVGELIWFSAKAKWILAVW